jgi:putative holliday junction resolvase
MILGIDPGERRIGVAVADEETKWARPLEVIDVNKTDPVARIAQLALDNSVDLIVVGRPVSMSGAEGRAVTAQRELVAELTRATDAKVAEFDERLTTVEAERGLRDAGVKAATRKKVRDAVAAQVMLQAYLDTHA